MEGQGWEGWAGLARETRGGGNNGVDLRPVSGAEKPSPMPPQLAPPKPFLQPHGCKELPQPLEPHVTTPLLAPSYANSVLTGFLPHLAPLEAVTLL